MESQTPNDSETPSEENLSRNPNRARTIILSLLVTFTVLEIVVLSPTSVEKPSTNNQEKIEKTVILDRIRGTEPTLAAGIPQNQIPEYAIRNFTYLASEGTRKDWKLLARKAHLYHPDSLIHARQVTAYLYDQNGSVTIVTGKEGKYLTDERDLEIYGDVVTKFSDGFTIYSDYLKYLPGEHRFHIPDGYPVTGGGIADETKDITFSSLGLDFDQSKDVIDLHDNVEFIVTKKASVPEGLPTQTRIESDACRIFRKTKVANFTMSTLRQNQDRFVRINQPDLFVKGRRVKLRYGDYSQILNYLTAYDDVRVKEMGEGEEPRYSTSGRVDFDTNKNLVILTKFPQVYQGEDTVTGEAIRIFRDSDIVEVDRSNAYNRGDEEDVDGRRNKRSKPNEE